MIYRLFELFINIFQSFIVTFFLIKCLGTKKCINGSNGWIEGLTGTVVTLIYLEILNKLTPFESFGIFLYLIISITYSIILLGGNLTEKFFYNILMLCAIVFSSLLGTGIVGMFSGKDYMQAIIPETEIRVISAILVQVILCVIFGILIYLKKMLESNDVRYMRILCVIPVISVVICCLIIYRENQSYMHRVIYTMIAVLGVFLVNVINIILMFIEHKMYRQRMQDRVLINAYEQKEKDVEAIKNIKIENDKYRHEIKNVVRLTTELLEDQKYFQATQFLNSFIEKRGAATKGIIYSDNVIMNYLLNRKVSECETYGIDITCFVNGVIDGIEDVDLYILLENLIDNAIEASVQTPKPKIHISIYSDEKNIEIEIGNSVKGNVLENNPNMHTSKKDKDMHGYGLQNVRDVVNRYNGSIAYAEKINNYIVCNTKLQKYTVHAK